MVYGTNWRIEQDGGWNKMEDEPKQRMEPKED